MAIIYRNALNRPLTNAELDANFEYLDTEVGLRYLISDFTAANISTAINTPAEGQTSTELIESNALNSWLLRDLTPYSLLPVATDKSSVVTRDSLGNFVANEITASLIGNADTATEADHAASSAALDQGVILNIVQGGTGASTATGARSSLAVLGTAGGEAMTGTLTLASSLVGLPSLRFGVGDDVQTGSSSNGDVWFTSSGLRYKNNGTIETVAKINSPTFTGVPKAPYGNNSVQIATISHVTYAIDALYDDVNEKGNHKLDLKANTNSPSFTGTVTAPTAGSSTNSTVVATTAFTQTVATSKANTAETNAKTFATTSVNDAIDALYDDVNEKGNHKLDLKANSNSPSLSGTPTAVTPSTSDNSTRIATTNYTVSYVSGVINSYYTKTQVDNLQPKWGNSRKFVQSTEPVDAVTGDFWFKV